MLTVEVVELESFIVPLFSKCELDRKFLAEVLKFCYHGCISTMLVKAAQLKEMPDHLIVIDVVDGPQVDVDRDDRG